MVGSYHKNKTFTHYWMILIFVMANSGAAFLSENRKLTPDYKV